MKKMVFQAIKMRQVKSKIEPEITVAAEFRDIFTN